MTTDNNNFSNNTTDLTGQLDALDQLFAQARSEQSELAGDNFTKMVINSLPAQHKRGRSRSYFPDFIGLIVAIVAVYFTFEPSQLFNSVREWLPTNVSISLANMVVLSLAFSCMAVVAWWSVEKSAEL